MPDFRNEFLFPEKAPEKFCKHVLDFLKVALKISGFLKGALGSSCLNSTLYPRSILLDLWNLFLETFYKKVLVFQEEPGLQSCDGEFAVQIYSEKVPGILKRFLWRKSSRSSWKLYRTTCTWNEARKRNRNSVTDNSFSEIRKLFSSSKASKISIHCLEAFHSESSNSSDSRLCVREHL